MKPFIRIKKSTTSVSSFLVDLTIKDIKNPLEDDDCTDNTDYSYANCVESKLKGQYVKELFYLQ